MSKKNDCWGIEVGSNAIKAIRLVREGAKVRLADFDVLPFKKILTTPDLDVDEAIQLNLDQLMQRHDLTHSMVMACVPGHMAFARFAKLPPVDDKKIPDIVKFEAVQQIPFPIEQVEWDYQVFRNPDSPDKEVGIFAIMRDRVMQYLENYREVGLDIDGLTLSPLAVYNGLAYDMELNLESSATVFMDIGTTSTDVVVAESNQTWMRTLPLGGNNFTEALVQAFKLSFPKAEKLKREATTSKYARQIYVAMRPVFAELVQEIQRSLGYYQSLNRNANLTQLVGVGSTFRLPGLRKFLNQQLELKVTRLEGFKRLTVEGKRASDLAKYALNLTTAYGLAIQGLGLEKVNANILPKRILKQRLWRAKQPWVGAAAALLIVATAAAAGKQWSDRRTFHNHLVANKQNVDSVVQQAKKKRQRWDAIEVQDSRQQIENLQRIPDYRQVWPKILHDVTSALSMLEPQSELLSPDYEAIAAIHRPLRRRAHIHSITSQYYGKTGQTDDEIWSRSDATDPSDFEDSEEDDEMENQGTGMRGFAMMQLPPSVVVTILGTTSHHQGQILLTRVLETWLAQNTERSDRPYRIIPVGGGQGLSIKPFGGSAAGGDIGRGIVVPRQRTQRSGATGNARATRRPLGRSGGGLLKGAPARGQSTSIEDILPSHPLAEELRDNDWKFEIIWRFELKPPDDARSTDNVPMGGDESDQVPTDADLAMENHS